MDQAFGDLESVLRLACLATIKGKTSIAKKLLSDARDTHRQRARLAKKRATSAVSFRSRLGGLYSTFLGHCELAQEAALADQLESLRRRWDTVSREILALWHDERGTRR